jgi:hypothetical protein
MIIDTKIVSEYNDKALNNKVKEVVNEMQKANLVVEIQYQVARMDDGTIDYSAMIIGRRK